MLFVPGISDGSKEPRLDFAAFGFMLRFKVLVGRKDRFVFESPMHAPMRNGLNAEEFD